MLRLSYFVVLTVYILSQTAAGHSNLKPAIQIRNGLSTVYDGTFENTNTDHFSLIYSSRETDGEKIAHFLEFAYYHFGSLFNGYDFKLQPLEEQLRWVTFTNKDAFNRYAIETEGRDLSWLTGYYSAKTNMVAFVAPDKISKWQVKAQERQAPGIIACPPDAETDLVKLVHEAGHQLSFNMGLQKRGVMYPIWANEGLAMFFERSLLSQYFQSSRYPGLRSRRLAEVYRSGRLIRLDRFISMTRLDKDSSAIDVYAQAWGLFEFLCRNRTNSLRLYFSSLYDIEPGFRSEQTLRHEFVRVFGSLDELENQWQRFLKGL
jgi:hypothetical protein